MRYLTERLRQSVFLLNGTACSRRFSPCWSPGINVMKWDCITGFCARRLAPVSHSTNWDAEPRSEGGHTSESVPDQQHDSAAGALTRPRARTGESVYLGRPFRRTTDARGNLCGTDVAVDPSLEPESTGITRPKSLSHLRRQRANLGFR